MAQFPALPLWTDAYLADTRHLTTEQHGAYLLLIMEAWRRPTCALPDSDEMLARLSGLSTERWAANRETIMAFWKHDGRKKEWTQSRLTRERDYVALKSRSQRDKAASRWKSNKKGDAVAMPEGMPEACRNDAPTPTPTPNITEPNGSVLSDPTGPDHSEPKKGKTRQSYPEAYEAVWKAYPTTPNMSKAEALPHWRKLSAQDQAKVAVSIPAYRAYLASKPDLEVIHFCRYLSKRRFDGFAGAIVTDLETPTQWAKRLDHGRRRQEWAIGKWGPMPGQDGCRVPSDLLEAGDGEGWREMKAA